MIQSFRNEVVLVGPMCVGKSTIANRIARSLNTQHLNIDCYKEQYFAELGYDQSAADNELKIRGIRGLYEYSKEFEFETLKEFLSISKGVFDIGAGFIQYFDSQKQAEIISLLHTFRNRFLLIPYRDKDKTMGCINVRFSTRFKRDPELKEILCSSHGFDLNRLLVDFYYANRQNFKVIETYRKSIRQISREIISSLEHV